MKILIFDFDGTIADSFDLVLAISNRLAEEFGYPQTCPEDVNHLKNLSSREIFRRSGVSFLRLPFLLRRLRIELNREIRQLQPIPGIQEALWALKRQGNRLGIVTSNSRENVIAFLETQNLLELFDFVDSGLTLFGKSRVIKRTLRQYRLDPTTVIYVGDETRDIEAARRTGVQAVAVTWGFNSSRALGAEYPDFLIHSPAELVKVAAC